MQRNKKVGTPVPSEFVTKRGRKECNVRKWEEKERSLATGVLPFSNGTKERSEALSFPYTNKKAVLSHMSQLFFLA